MRRLLGTLFLVLLVAAPAASITLRARTGIDFRALRLDSVRIDSGMLAVSFLSGRDSIQIVDRRFDRILGRVGSHGSAIGGSITIIGHGRFGDDTGWILPTFPLISLGPRISNAGPIPRPGSIVPEPSAGLVFATGLLVAGGARRRRSGAAQRRASRA